MHRRLSLNIYLYLASLNNNEQLIAPPIAFVMDQFTGRALQELTLIKNRYTDPTPNPTPGGQTDPFGIQKIYLTKSGGEEWFMDMSNGQDPRSRPPSMTRNPAQYRRA
jgi:hypothetical protein